MSRACSDCERSYGPHASCSHDPTTSPATPSSAGPVSNHTPGPWEADTTASNCVSVGPIGFARWVSPVEDEDRANAHLIAAAPELLAALRAYLGAYETTSGIDWRQAERMARAAIARAEGRAE